MDDHIFATADVGRHHGSEMQSHVPLEVLRSIGASPGDRIQYWTVNDRAVLRVVDDDA